MATLGQLKDRIIRETNREELLDAPGTDPTAANSDTLILAMQRAIEFHADRRFLFNEATIMTSTNAAGDLVEYPGNLRRIDRISVSVGGNRYDLKVQDYTTIDAWAGYGVAAGQPTDYAVTTGYLRFYPTPNLEYPLTILGIVDIDMGDFLDDDLENGWTQEGQDLIAARTRFILMRDYFRDNDGALVAAGAEQEALSNMQGNVLQRFGTGRIRGSW